MKQSRDVFDHTQFLVGLCISAMVMFYMPDYYFARKVESIYALIADMMHVPKVCIIVPNYNKGDLMPRALDSALNQSLKDIEIVIADDGSNDTSMAVAVNYSQRDPRIRYYHNEPNMLTNANRAKAVRTCRAEFVMSLDSDDELTWYIAEMDYKAAIENNADIVEHLLNWITMKGRVKPFIWKEPRFDVMGNDQIVTEFWNGDLNWNLPRKMIRRSVYLKALDLLGNATTKRIGWSEDRMHCGAIYKLAKKFVFVRKLGYIYYRNTLVNSWTRTPNATLEEEFTNSIVDQIYEGDPRKPKVLTPKTFR